VKEKDKRMDARGKRQRRAAEENEEAERETTRGSCQRLHRERERERERVNCRLRAFNSRSKDRNDPSLPSRHRPLFPTSKLLLNSPLLHRSSSHLPTAPPPPYPARLSPMPQSPGPRATRCSPILPWMHQGGLLSLRFSLSTTIDRPLCRFIAYADVRHEKRRRRRRRRRTRAMKRIRASLKEKRG